MGQTMTKVNQVMACVDRQVERARFARKLGHRLGASSGQPFKFLISSGFIQLCPVINGNMEFLKDFVEPNGLALIGSGRIGPPIGHATATDVSTDVNRLGAAHDFTTMNDGEATGADDLSLIHI